MDNLRSELRAAFEREQKAEPMTSDMRQRVALAAIAPPGAQANLQWVAVVATALIGTIVIAALMSSHVARNVGQVRPQASPAATPPASPSASPAVEDYGPPPAGVPLFYVRDSNNPTWFIGYDWSGAPRGTIKLRTAATGGLDAAPDGSGFGYAINGKGAGIETWLDRFGQPISDADQTNYQSVMWAPDSLRICTLDGTGGQWRLGLKTQGSPSVAHVVTIPGSSTWGGIIALSIAACDPGQDRAVLVRNYFGAQPSIWVVRISDGAILSGRALVANDIGNISVSSDGKLIAENSSKSDGYLLGGAAQTIVRRAADGSVVVALNPTYNVIAFSADDTVALAATSPLVEGQATHMALLRVADGAVIWRYDGPGQFDGRWIQPNGSDIAVAVREPHGTTTLGVFIVHADGTSNSLNGLP